MLMLRTFRHRERRPELMDDLSGGGPQLQEALVHLRGLNRLFGAAYPTLYGVKRLWREAGRPKVLTVIDIGAGSGDVNGRLLEWATREGVNLRLTLMDITEEAIREARLYYGNEPRVRVCRGNLFELDKESADVVTGTQLLHHFADEELERAVACMLNASRLGVVVNDIHRHWLPWSAVWLATRLISRNPYIRHDGPLSVAKGFRASDWKALRQRLHGVRMRSSWRPLFRYAVIIYKTEGKRDGV